MHSSPVIAREVAISVIASVLCLATIALAGCSQPSSMKTPAPTMAASQTTSTVMGATADTSSDVAPCYECSGKGTPPVVVGKARVVGGTQIVSIKIVDGYYSPNKVTVKAGAPVTVVFTGKAKDCVGKPKFASLSKQVDIRSTGTGTIDLGSLTAGTYVFTCGMGVNAGSITAE